jgi:small-conductance mechanosensitive channel
MLQQTSGQIENQAPAAIQITRSSADAFNNAPIDTVIDNQLHHQFANNIGSTLISGVVILLTFMAIYFIFRNKSYTPKQKLRYRFRLIYIAIFCYLILLARIWVEGFEHIFTMLSLVGAGIVVTNKETVMNFVGFLIINWRNLFTEGDVIQIGTNIGVVGNIGPLYFRLYETSGIDRLETTGKSIKIPNGLVITLPVTSISPENNLMQYSFILLAEPELNKLKLTLETLQDKFNLVLNHYYKKSCTEGFKRLEESHDAIRKFIHKKCSVSFSYTPGKDKHAEVSVRFFCYPKDQRGLQWKLLEIIEEESMKGSVHLTVPASK